MKPASRTPPEVAKRSPDRPSEQTRRVTAGELTYEPQRGEGEGMPAGHRDRERFQHVVPTEQSRAAACYEGRRLPKVLPCRRCRARNWAYALNRCPCNEADDDRPMRIETRNAIGQLSHAGTEAEKENPAQARPCPASFRVGANRRDSLRRKGSSSRPSRSEGRLGPPSDPTPNRAPSDHVALSTAGARPPRGKLTAVSRREPCRPHYDSSGPGRS